MSQIIKYFEVGNPNDVFTQITLVRLDLTMKRLREGKGTAKSTKTINEL